MDTQNTVVLDYLKTHKRGLSALDAVQRLGIMRLSGRIFDLRRAGYDIETITRESKNRYGKTVRYGVYMLRG